MKKTLVYLAIGIPIGQLSKGKETSGWAVVLMYL